jgi:D-3-phosphoglycerate dehydrogenase
VNAAAIASSRGLQVHEFHKPKSSTGGSGSVLSVLLKTGVGEHRVKGAVLHGHAPRLLSVDDIDVEAPLERNLIYLRNRDVPGVIGKVGTILGEHKINIADFSLGRQAGNGGTENKARPRNAVAVVHVDGRVPDDVLKALRKVAAIEQAKAIRLF